MVDQEKNTTERRRSADSEAFDLIDELGRKLLALNGEEKLPSHWLTRWKKAIKPIPKNAGRQEDLGKIAGMAKARTLNRAALSTNTKDRKPGQVKKEIADAIGVSTRAVERIGNDMEAILVDGPRDIDGHEMSPEKMSAMIAGIAEGLTESRSNEDEKIEKAKQKQVEEWMRAQGIQLVSAPPSHGKK